MKRPVKSPADELLALIRRKSKRIRPLPTVEEESGSLPRRPQCVLFDIYGTLLIRVETGKKREVEAVNRRYRLSATGSELDAALNDAIARERSAARNRGSAHPEVAIESIWAGLFPALRPEALRKAIVEYELAAHPAWPMPGCQNLLRSLARAGVTVGIVSNAQFYTPLFLSALLGASLADLGFSSSLCLYSCNLGIAKPDPALFRLAADRLQRIGIHERETLVVGNDHANDIAPAALAGFMTVRAAMDRRSSVPTGKGNGWRGPDAVIRGLASLKRLMEEAP